MSEKYSQLTDMTKAKVVFRPCKKIKPAMAVQIHEDFIVDTLEGQHRGHAGDYLMEGIKGERYPCRKDIFEESYEWIEE